MLCCWCSYGIVLIGLFGCCILIWVFALCFGVVFVFDCVLGV